MVVTMPDFIPWAMPVFWGDEEDLVLDALKSTWISGGKYVERLESEIQNLWEVPHAIVMSNGTTAIHSVFLSLGIRPGDEIVVPGFGFLAGANLALQMNARPVFADVDPNTWLVTATEIEKKITKNTKAILVTHSYGNVCEMDEICSLGKEHNIPIIEDAAESFGSLYKGQAAGTIGDFGTFSFQATKVITTGEGGMVITSSDGYAEKLRLFRSHGMLRKRYYWHELPGHNFRLTNLQAALGCAQLNALDRIIVERKRIHDYYTELLSDVEGITLQRYSKNVDPLLWAMAMKLDSKAFPQGRDAVMQEMYRLNIETRPGFYTPTRIGFYPNDYIPICEDISATTISLPTYPSLKNSQIRLICQNLVSLRR